jgi:NSS family neurotransmitter:Na+ symporter
LVNQVSEQRSSSSLWGSKLDFIVAALASALGLGSLWRFPYIAAKHGGGLFIVVYLLCIVLVGVTGIIAEVVLGRAAGRSPVRAFGHLASSHGDRWRWLGGLGVVAGVIILSYYSVVCGWALHYCFMAVRGTLPVTKDPLIYEGLFNGLVQTPGVLLFWHVIVMLITALVVVRGVKGGIQRCSEWLMGLLAVILVVLCVYSMTLPTFGDAMGLVFGLHSKDFTIDAVLEALGHAFFTLSLGMGAMMTYGSYLKRDEDIVSSSILVAVADTAASLVACLIVYPVATAGGILDPDQGPGLIFMNLPVAVQALPFGRVWIGFVFLLFFVAGLASAFSLLEVPVSMLIDSFGCTRRVATAIAGFVITILGIPTALSWSGGFFGTAFFGGSWFDLVDNISSNWLLALGSLGICLFVAFGVDQQIVKDEFVRGSRYGWLYHPWRFVITRLAPILIVVILAGKFILPG